MSVRETVVERLRARFPDLEDLSHEPGPFPASKFDLHARDRSGHEYFVEVKPRPCHRVDLGQMVELASLVSKESPSATVVLVCSSIDKDVGDLLERAGIEILLIPEVATRLSKEPRAGTVSLDLSPREQEAYFALLRAEKKVVSTKGLARVLGVSRRKAASLLASLHSHGVLFRIGRGKYAVLPPDVLYDKKGYTADPYIVTAAFMEGEEYYVSHASAAHLRGIVTQVPLATFVSTLKPKRPLRLDGSRIRFVTVKPSRFFGTEEMDYQGSTIQVSDLEKTAIDCVDRPDLIGGMDEAVRILAEAHEDLDWERLARYARRMSRKALVQRLGFLLEKLSGVGFEVPEEALERLDRIAARKFPYPLDPKRGRTGAISPRWRVYENVDCLAWYHA